MNSVINFGLYLTCVSFVLAYEFPVHLWPMGRYSYTHEVMTSIQSDNYQCGMNFEGSTTISQYITPLVLDGSKYPYVDLNVGSLALNGDFSFTIHLKPTVNVHGCIFEYQSTDSDSNITRVKACLDAGMINVVKTIGNSVDESGAVSSGLVVGQWSFISVGISYNGGYFDLYLDNNHHVINSSFLTKRTLKTPGKLRIGGAFSEGKRFAGAMTCIGLYPIIISYSNKQNTINECTFTTSWNYYQFMAAAVWSNPDGCSLLVQTTEAPQMPVDRSNGLQFSKAGTNVSPKSTSETPLLTVTVSTQLFCGWICFSNDLCKSFTVVSSADLHFTCSLLSEMHSNDDLESQAMTTYYKLSN